MKILYFLEVYCVDCKLYQLGISTEHMLIRPDKHNAIRDLLLLNLIMTAQFTSVILMTCMVNNGSLSF